MKEDLMTVEREGKGKVSIIFALDASASMKGKKIETCKKAGIALAYKAIEEKDDVGLVIFGSDIKKAIPPTQDFSQLLHAMTRITATRQTDFEGMRNKQVMPIAISAGSLGNIINAMNKPRMVYPTPSKNP